MTANRSQLNLGTFPPKLKTRLQQFADKRSISIAAAARLLISEGLDRTEPDKKTRPAISQ